MVIAAVVGSAVVGGVAANSAAKKGAAAQNRATDAAGVADAERIALDRERFGFERDQYNAGEADRAFASQTARDVSGRQIKSMDQQFEIADDYYNYQKSTFRPLEQGLIRDAENFNSEARRESEVNKTLADVSRSFGAAREQSTRDMGRRSVNPSSGRALAMVNQTDIAQATAMAGAASKARADIEAKGFAMRSDAASLGRNLPGNQTASATLASNMGNSGVSNSLVPISVANNGTDRMSSAYGGMSGALTSSFNNALKVGGIQSQNFYDSQAFGRQTGSDVSSALLKGYGMATGQYNPFK
jgi:hypothetical protein